MRGDKLHDALNHLDDDLIEGADKRRRNTDGNKKILLRLIPAAACLCLILTGILVAKNRGLPDNDQDFAESGKPEGSSVIREEFNEELADENDASPKPQSTDTSDRPIIPEDHAGIGKDELADEAFPESVPENATDTEDEELPSFGIMIDQWQEDELYAVITEHTDTEILPIGTRVRVVFSDECYILTPVDGGYYDKIGKPTEEEFPEGARATVQFYGYENNNGEIILYSGLIMKEE